MHCRPIILITLAALPASAQPTWSGDFRGSNFYQFQYIQCGAFEGSGGCPYTSQQANTTTTQSSAVNCTSPADAGCRFELVNPPANSVPYTQHYNPVGKALRVTTAHNPDSIPDNGDSAPLAGNPWGEDHRNELNQSRDFANPNLDTSFKDGDEVWIGFSAYVPPTTEPPSTTEFRDPPPDISNIWGHLILQIHNAQGSGSPYVGINLWPIVSPTGPKWHWRLDGRHVGGAARDLWTDPSEVTRGRWYNFILNVKFSSNENIGRVALFIDQTQVYPTAGTSPTLQTLSAGNGYLKYGLKRDFNINTTETIYLHGLKASNSWSTGRVDVDPQRLVEDFELGLPVDWKTTGYWTIRSKNDTCGIANGGNLTVAFNYPSPFGSCTYSTIAPFGGDPRSFGEVTTKPFSVPSTGANLYFKHRSQTEQHAGWDVRTVYVSAPGVGVTQIAQYCGPKSLGLPHCTTCTPCPDSGNATSMEYQSFPIPSQFNGRNDVTAIFSFDSVDGAQNNFGGWWINDVGVANLP